MALSAKAGQLKTRIYVKEMKETVDPDGFPLTDDDGYPIKTWENVFPSFVWCLWHNNVGSQRTDDMRIDLRENVEITTRYSPLINVRCRVWLANDPQDEAHAYEILTVNNADMLNKYLDIKLRRVVVG